MEEDDILAILTEIFPVEWSINFRTCQQQGMESLRHTHARGVNILPPGHKVWKASVAPLREAWTSYLPATRYGKPPSHPCERREHPTCQPQGMESLLRTPARGVNILPASHKVWKASVAPLREAWTSYNVLCTQVQLFLATAVDEKLGLDYADGRKRVARPTLELIPENFKLENVYCVQLKVLSAAKLHRVNRVMRWIDIYHVIILLVRSSGTLLTN